MERLKKHSVIWKNNMRNILFQLIIMSLIAFGASLYSNVSKADQSLPAGLSDHKNSANGNDPVRRDGRRELSPEVRAHFDRGYKYFSKKKYFKAILEFYSFLEHSTPDDQDHEWAEFFFGVGLHQMGFSHAAVDILAHLVMRKPNPQIVTYCLELFEEIMRNQPFDYHLLVNRVLCDQEYGFLEGNLVNYVNFYQGLYAWRNGFRAWGDEHFAKIAPKTHYYNRFLFQKALLAVYQDRIGSAVSLLRKILSDSDEDDKLLDDVRLTLARLLYEQGAYGEADRLYWEIQENILGQSRNLIERAWAHYRMGNAERAMGLLYAFKAPSYKNAFTPEYYILKSFIYKDVCHYQHAMEMVAEFKSRYGRTLENIYRRKGPLENRELLVVVLNKEKIERLFRFVELLENEQAQLEKLTDAPDLINYLKEIYILKMKQSKAELRKVVNEQYEVLANEMLEYEEEAYLMEYEIGLDMYQRVSQVHFDETKEKAEEDDNSRGVTRYPFQGEFWNDELADYRVILPNKCNNMEEWDIFFK